VDVVDAYGGHQGPEATAGAEPPGGHAEGVAGAVPRQLERRPQVEPRAHGDEAEAEQFDAAACAALRHVRATASAADHEMWVRGVSVHVGEVEGEQFAGPDAGAGEAERDPPGRLVDVIGRYDGVDLGERQHPIAAGLADLRLADLAHGVDVGHLVLDGLAPYGAQQHHHETHRARRKALALQGVAELAHMAPADVDKRPLEAPPRLDVTAPPRAGSGYRRVPLSLEAVEGARAILGESRAAGVAVALVHVVDDGGEHLVGLLGCAVHDPAMALSAIPPLDLVAAGAAGES